MVKALLEVLLKVSAEFMNLGNVGLLLDENTVHMVDRVLLTHVVVVLAEELGILCIVT
jgi:hypothetical protein